MRNPANYAKGTIAVLLLAVLVTGLGCSAGAGGGSAPPPPAPPPPPGPALQIATQSPLPRAVTGQSYSVTLQATGGIAPYTWNLVAGQAPLPSGLTFAATGVLSGTPTVTIDLFPLFQVQDTKGTTATARLEILCVAPMAFTVGSGLSDGNVGVSYSSSVFAGGGALPYTFTLASGSNPLPGGLTLAAQGAGAVIQGTPTLPGSYSFTLQVADSGTPPLQASQLFNVKILNNLVVAPTGLPIGVLNVPYSQPLKTAGGTPPYHWAITGQFSTIPPGLTFDSSNGTIQGIPTATGSFSFLVQVTDSATPTPNTITTSLIMSINPPLSFRTTSLPDFGRGLGYFSFIFMDGGRPPDSAQVTNGALPDGLSINSLSGNGFTVGGTPTKDGLFKFTLQVSDSYDVPNKVTQDFQVRISEPIAISGPSSAQLLEGQAYSASFPATGGFPPYTWSATNVPPSFTFDTTTGILQGTVPAPPGVGQGGGPTFPSIFITVHDSSSPPMATSTFFGAQVFGKLRIATSLWPAIATGSNIWLVPWVSGGIGPYAWSMTSGSLPPGLTLRASDGLISGTPTAAGSYALTLAVADGNQGSLAQNTSRQLTLTVKDRGQLTRNDTIAQATPLSNGLIVASISPFDDSSSSGPDLDVYQVSAAPGALVQVYASANIDAIQPPNPNSLRPVLEVVDGSGKRYQSCSSQGNLSSGPYTFPCVNGLNGQFSPQAYYILQVPGSGTAPVTFYIRVLDARGDARPDFLYTLAVFGVN